MFLTLHLSGLPETAGTSRDKKPLFLPACHFLSESKARAFSPQALLVTTLCSPGTGVPLPPMAEHQDGAQARVFSFPLDGGSSGRGWSGGQGVPSRHPHPSPPPQGGGRKGSPPPCPSPSRGRGPSRQAGAGFPLSSHSKGEGIQQAIPARVFPFPLDGGSAAMRPLVFSFPLDGGRSGRGWPSQQSIFSQRLRASAREDLFSNNELLRSDPGQLPVS